MRTRLRVLPLSLFLAAGVVAFAAANSSVPPLGSSGSPRIGATTADATCGRAGCHAGNPLNNGAGTLEILGLPDSYTPGTTYPITVRLGSSATAGSPNRRWGFQLTACLAADGLGSQAGGFTVPTGILTQSFPLKERTYVSHSSSTLRQGQAGFAEWGFEWTAPPAPRGTILFFAAGNAANGNGSSSGDFIYTASDSVTAGPVPVAPTSWGSIKAGAR